jgi:hypothetical protein
MYSFYIIFWALIFLKYTQWQCILSYDNSTAMYKFQKNLTPWRESCMSSLFWQSSHSGSPIWINFLILITKICTTNIYAQIFVC